MRFLDLDPDVMRLPSFPGQIILGDRGENLSSVLQTICKDPTGKHTLLQWIQELTPMDAKDFEFPVDLTGKILLTLVEESGQKTSAYSASDGTLRFLATIAALLGPEPASFYFFEELENGIHPTRLHLLLGVCAEILTPIENLLVYGTIITYAHDGVLHKEAKIWERHYESIQSHSRDWRKLNKLLPLCVAGDFNEALSQPFSYGTPKGREMLYKGLEQSNLVCVTANNEIGYNIDHICLSLEWAKRVQNVSKWQAYKTNGNPVTDHFGVCVDLFLNK